MQRVWQVILGLLILAQFSAHAAADVRYRMVDLNPRDGVNSAPHAINDHGQVVGRWWQNPVEFTPYVFSDGRTTDISPRIFPQAINNQGQVLGVDDAAGIGGYLYDIATGRGSSLFTDEQRMGFAGDVNDVGQVVGNVYPVQGPPYAAIYDDGMVRPLPSFPAPSIPVHINNAGQVLAINASATETYYLYENGQHTKLEFYANDLNDRGEIAGNGWVADGVNRIMHAYLYRNGVLEDLGYIGGGSFLNGINESGQMVGHWAAGPGAALALLYQDGEFFDLNELVEDRAGWTLTQAQDINNDGWIIANGEREGQRHAMLLIPVPEPGCATAAMLLVTLAGSRGVWRRNAS